MRSGLSQPPAVIFNKINYQKTRLVKRGGFFLVYLTKLVHEDGQADQRCRRLSMAARLASALSLLRSMG